MGRACGTYGRGEVRRVLVERPERKRKLGRLRSRWEVIFKQIFKNLDRGMY